MGKNPPPVPGAPCNPNSALIVPSSTTSLVRDVVEQLRPKDGRRKISRTRIHTHIITFSLPFSPNISPSFCCDMGQILEKLQGKQWREKKIRKISDKVFDYFKDDAGKVNMTFEDLYIAVLLVYNDINKHLPGPHFDPPKKEEIRILMKECDLNLDGGLNHEEFEEFVKRLTADTFVYVTQGLIITLALAPTVAIATKRSTEGVPGIGKVVQKLPNSVYAGLITFAVMMIQKANE
ncbi:hypothetical protein L6452_20176 [Arctium lappa]|uniref:Uncharacterized protein n=1 Tax=Arctium lappa TaxID=4217 RepID=A0ACB9BBX7_ARCLA|nr:hypothetical protein L6452_20176 [Arctium lappa]